MASEFSARELEVWRAFYTMRRHLEAKLERRLQADAGISSADYEILIALHQEPTKRLRAGRIGDIIGWEKSRVSHQISRMEQRDLLTREECGDDARGVWIVLSEEGSRAVRAALVDRTAAVREYFFDVTTPEEQDLIVGLSGKVLDAIAPAVCVEDRAEQASAVV